LLFLFMGRKAPNPCALYWPELSLRPSACEEYY